MITLTNGVQVPENAVQLQTTAAIDGYYVTQPLQLVQYDETLPVAAVQLTYQSQPYIPPTGAELNVRMNKPDGKGVYNPCLGVDSSGIVYFVFTQQMTIVAGTGTLTVEITDSGVKNSAPIIAEIRPNPVPEGSIESADEFLTLQEILAEAEKWGQIVQTNAANIQQVVDNLEDIQNAAENAKAAAESAAAAQKAAQEALGFRTFFSAVTPDANGNLDPSRPMTVGPAASVEIESAGDRIQSVTALGFTTQAGTGDPSPSNVRKLTNGGMRYGVVVYDGSSDESYGTNGQAFIINPKPSDLVPLVGPDTISPLVCNRLASKAASATWGGQQGVSQASASDGRVQVFVNGVTTTQGIREWLQQNPITVWYPLETGTLYAPIILTSGEYRATCLDLTAPLCDGDSVVSWVKSGCDKVVTFDGSEDEGWAWLKSPSGVYRAYVSGFSDYLAGETKLTNAYVSGDVASQVGVFSISGGNFLVTPKDFQTDDGLSQFTAALAARPLTVWYRSTHYTPTADIPVSLETHQRTVLVLDGAENWATWGIGLYRFVTSLKGTNTSNGKCSHMPYVYSFAGNGIFVDKDGNVAIGTGFIAAQGYQSVSDWKSYLATQYAAGTPVTIIYKLAAPLVYAHPAVVLEAATGDQLTYTVTGQSGGTVSVALKPFQDGGNAKRLDGLTLATLQNLLVPVGYIFSWAPVDDGPDLSTPAKVAEYFGFGTWQAYGTGQVLVGVDSGQTEFATPGKTGGEKMHTLTTQELPSVSPGVKYSNGKPIALDSGGTDGYKLSFTSENVTPNNIVAPFGGNQPHNNLQPYITVYRWQRVA